MKDNKLFIIMPAYNEAENLAELVAEWYPWTETSEDSKILIIDDGSTDNTIEVLKNLQGRFLKLQYITKKNSGHGPSVTFAYKKALEAGADFIFQTDSDCQTSPEDFSIFWKNRDKFDVQLGYRFDRRDGVIRKFVSSILSVVIRILFKENVKDSNVPFRLFNNSALSNIIKYIPDDFVLSNVLASVIAQKLQKENKISLTRHKITFLPRKAGEKSINLKSIFRFAEEFINQSSQLKQSSRWKKDFGSI